MDLKKPLIALALIALMAAGFFLVRKSPEVAPSATAHRSSRLFNSLEWAMLRQGVKCDRAGAYAEAAEWYRMAAERGLAEAQNNLGVMLKDGQGVMRDYAEAAHWFLLAARQGYVLAQSNLGWLYQSGNGVEQNYAEARRWYLAAACRGHAAAQNNLGTMYRDGQGVEQNADSARYWLQQAAAQGMQLAQRNLEKMDSAGAE